MTTATTDLLLQMRGAGLLPEAFRETFRAAIAELPGKEVAALELLTERGNFRFKNAARSELRGAMIALCGLAIGLDLAAIRSKPSVAEEAKEQLAAAVKAAGKAALETSKELAEQNKRIAADTEAFIAKQQAEADAALRLDPMWRIERIEKHLGIELED